MSWHNENIHSPALGRDKVSTIASSYVDDSHYATQITNKNKTIYWFSSIFYQKLKIIFYNLAPFVPYRKSGSRGDPTGPILCNANMHTIQVIKILVYNTHNMGDNQLKESNILEVQHTSVT